LGILIATPVQIFLAYRRENDDSVQAWHALDKPSSLKRSIATEEDVPASVGTQALDVYAELDDLPGDAAERIALSLDAAALPKSNQERIVDRSAYDAAEIARVLFELADEGWTPWRAIERFAYADPDVYVEYWDRLIGDPEEMGFYRMMACCHVARAHPDRAAELVDALEPYIKADDVGMRQAIAIAFGELSVVDDRAAAHLDELVEDSDPDVRNFATRARAFFEDAPYGRIDRNRENRETPPGQPPDIDHASDPAGTTSPENTASATTSAGSSSTASATSETTGGGGGSTADAGSGTGGRSADYSYDCESCGATLWDEMDITSTDVYSCGVCGHELDDQEGAKQTYLYG
jgi:DNA-directed RNA polymerase subunit RPC12/RpoP